MAYFHAERAELSFVVYKKKIRIQLDNNIIIWYNQIRNFRSLNGLEIIFIIPLRRKRKLWQER